MNREEYLAALRKSLGRTAEEEKKEILADYDEHFRVGLSEGRTEEEIAKALGNPSAIGKTYRIENLADETRKGWGLSDVFRAVFASVSLGFFNIIVVLGPFLGLAGVLIGMWAAAVSIGVSGITVILAAIVGPFLQGVYGFNLTVLNVGFAFFAGACCAALGVLAVIGMVFLTKWFFVLTARYVKFNARIITGKKQEA